MYWETVLPRTGVLLLVAALFNPLISLAGAAEPTPGELLQKAIYTEETVGDIDAAMKLYEQVIAEGKSAQESAAQAQYRLALCYEKKGEEANARSAFEALIADYPGAKELVAEARKHLPRTLKLLPAPWQPGERMQLSMKLATGLDIGTMVYMVDAVQHDGKDVTRCSTRGLVTIGGVNSYSEVLCDTESFKPIESLWKHSLLGEATTVYGDSTAKIDVIGKDRTFTLDFTPPAFDNEQCVELFRRLPLADGYKTTLNVITSLGGSKIQLPLSVTKKETLSVPAGTFECYQLELGVVAQTFWISNDEHRYVVRFAAGGVTAELAKVWQAEQGAGEQVVGDGYSLALPPGWLSYDVRNPAEPNVVVVALLDPHAAAKCQLEVRPKSSLQGDQAASTKAWTDSYVDEFKRSYSDFSLVDPGLTDLEVGGHPATQVVADFTGNGKKMRMLGVAVLSETSAATLNFTAEAAKFDELGGQFDAIVEGFQLK